ncbi:uncharacterized protein MELLADRAFT_77936 [Melampsora larici-populina 98AG31]|uniref:Mediator of RNA polymerase II transcription subunit 7 n=1 Tax=Melampsora larici-populina (strain 98AG31 / pathotype 3-4-7) TaxID=747676 RepID=F4RNL5_MELLP|nr:uncharacterized protein MELLADRAFT_77936 [Melampsora larici-populina 98AG31]EGG06071.1 hypothetical protein MELLADRAFT_77936 [Melampsora larici-populina 98AG31]
METTETNSSFFPAPPTRYLQFTKPNLTIAKSIQSKTKPNELQFDSDLQKRLIKESLKDLKDIEEIDEEEIERINEIDLRTLLEPPNLDLIKERGGWSSFGDWEPWPGKSSRAMLEGMPKLYEEKMERKDALQALLNTLIYSYLKLLNQLGHQGPPSLSNHSNQVSNTDQIISHIELTSFNMHGLCNELRPRQARETLKLMMKEQAKEKREKARLVLKTCEDLKNDLIGLKNHSGSFDDPIQNIQSNETFDDSMKETDEKTLLKEKQQDWNALLSVVDDL